MSQNPGIYRKIIKKRRYLHYSDERQIYKIDYLGFQEKHTQKVNR